MATTSAPSSFIPQDTAVPYAHRRRDGGGLNELILLCAVVLLIASIALGAGVFLYQKYLDADSASKLKQINSTKDSFDPSLIHELTRLDDRMKASDHIMAAHLGPTALFTALEHATLKTVGFKTLNLEVGDLQHVGMKMAGVAQSVNSIALQADIFSKSGIITGPIFSDIARDKDGVHFSLTASINPSSLNYVSLVSGIPGVSPQDIVAPTDTGATPTPFTAPANAQKAPAATP